MPSPSVILRPVVAVGSAALGVVAFVGGVGQLVGDALKSARRGLVTGRGLVSILVAGSLTRLVGRWPLRRRAVRPCSWSRGERSAKGRPPDGS